MKYLGITLILIAAIFSCNVHGFEFDLPEGTRITFLTQDAPGGWDHAGYMGYVLEPVEAFVRECCSSSFVPYDLGTLIKADVAPYYIFSKSYCEPIGKILSANLFVMTQVDLLSSTASTNPWKFNIRAKAYSSVSGRELPIFEAKEVTKEEALQKVRQELQTTLDHLRRVVEVDG